MSIMTKQRCLVLNKSWTPIKTIPLRRAVIMLFSEHNDGTPKARVIEPESYQAFTWEDWSKMKPLATDEAIQAANIRFKVPEIILLSRYNKLPKPKVHFSRRNLYKRDEMTCQYCGKQPGSAELNIDHVIPRAQGGQSSWENCVLSCIPCNSKKANRQPHECGMKLLKTPKKPKMDMFKLDELSDIPDSWNAFISEAYWSVEMK